MEKVYWLGSVPEKDDFGSEIKDFFIDGRTEFGPWAIMSKDSFYAHGIKLGTGWGQIYKKQSDGKWLKVKG